MINILLLVEYDNMKKALITGITGQDGAYLADFLLKKGYKVFGTYRRTSTPNFWRLQSLGIFSKIHLIPSDLLDMGSLVEAVHVSNPDELYNLAASSFVSSAFEQPVGNAELTGLAVTKLLESVRIVNPNLKFYQASSSEMYGNSKTKIQDENTPLVLLVLMVLLNFMLIGLRIFINSPTIFLLPQEFYLIMNHH